MFLRDRTMKPQPFTDLGFLYNNEKSKRSFDSSLISSKNVITLGWWLQNLSKANKYYNEGVIHSSLTSSGNKFCNSWQCSAWYQILLIHPNIISRMKAKCLSLAQRASICIIQCYSIIFLSKEFLSKATHPLFFPIIADIQMVQIMSSFPHSNP